MTPGVILRLVPYGEADVIATVLFRDLGVQSVFLKAARRSQKRFAGLIDLFQHLNWDVQEHASARWLKVLQVELYETVRLSRYEDLARLSCLAEIILVLAAEGDTNHDIYHTWLDVVASITDTSAVPATVMTAVLKVMATLGYSLDGVACSSCEGLVSLNGQWIQFDPPRGMCPQCCQSQTREVVPLARRWVRMRGWVESHMHRALRSADLLKWE